MSGQAARPNAGFVITGVAAASRSSSRGSVAPSSSGASSVTTAGMSSSRATDASHTAFSTASSAAVRSGSDLAKKPGCVSTTTRTLSERSTSGMPPS